MSANGAEAPRPSSSWTPVDLVGLNLAPPEPPSISSIVYPGLRHVFSGDTESLKTWATLVLCAEQIQAGGTAVFIDFGEGGRRDIYSRLRDLGLTDDEIRGRFVYLEPEEPATMPQARRDIAELAALDPALVVFDATTGALELHGLDPNKGSDVQSFYRQVVGPFRTNGAALIVIDHLTRNREARGKFAIGSERKIGATDVHLSFETVVPFGRGRVGLAKIATLKDRPGYLPRPKCAELQLTSSSETGEISWKLDISSQQQSEQTFRPTILMERVSMFVEHTAEPPSRNVIETDVKGARGGIRTAIDTLVQEGYLQARNGTRGATHYASQRPYRQSTDEPAENDFAPTSPTDSPATSPRQEPSGLTPLPATEDNDIPW